MRRIGLQDSDGLDDPESAESYARLHRAGWSAGDAAFVGEAGTLVWIVTGHNGENLIRAEGRTREAAWSEACRQAAAVGMLG